jgi:hypothetical protein
MAIKLPVTSQGNRDPFARLQGLREVDLIEKIIVPLFEALGFEGVENRHGTLEKGKDIIAWNRDKFGEMEVTVASVKREKLSGRATGSGHLTNVCTQLMQCLNEPVIMKDGTTRLPSSVWFVSPFPLDPTALELSFQTYSKALANRIKVIDGPKLLRAIKTHCPGLLTVLGEALPSHLDKVKREIPLLHEARALNIASPMPLERFFVEHRYRFSSLRARVDLDFIEGRERVELANLSAAQIDSLIRLDSTLRSLTTTGLSPDKTTGDTSVNGRSASGLKKGILAGRVKSLSAKKAVQSLRTTRRQHLDLIARAFRHGHSIAERRSRLDEFVNWQDAAEPLFQNDAFKLIVGKRQTVRPAGIAGSGLPVFELIDAGMPLLVRGDAGSGKTTLLRVTASRLAQQDGKIPVYVALSSMADDDIEAGLRSAFGKYGYEISHRQLRKLLAEGRVVVLLDGLDVIGDVASHDSWLRAKNLLLVRGKEKRKSSNATSRVCLPVQECHFGQCIRIS